MIPYYDRRAASYEAIYARDDPARRRELADVASRAREVAGDEFIIACDANQAWTPEQAIAAHKRRIRSIAFSPDGLHLASAGDDRHVRVWSHLTGEEVTSLRVPGAKIYALSYISNQLLATGGSDNTIRLWDLKDNTNRYQLSGHTGSVVALTFDAVSQTLVSGSYDTTVRVWDLGTLDQDLMTRRPSTQVK